MLTLTQPIKFGALTLPNRIVMSPMTRNRSPMEVPTALNAQYYAQRATAGLIISEATAISLEGLGWGGTPGIFTPEQVAGWHHVVNEVHAAGGRIFSQMWHCGACSHPSTRRGALPLSASPLRLGGTVRTPLGRLPMVGTSEMSIDDIRRTVDDYRTAARNALAAGFDGVEVHAANGYLLDQFLRSSTNWRQDEYGGSPGNRCRLLFEVVEAVAEIWGRDRVGVRVSPTSPTNYVLSESDPETLLAVALEGLDRLGVCYVAVVEGSSNGAAPTHQLDYSLFKREFGRLYVANNGYTLESGEAALNRGDADLISFGRLFIANPDLVKRAYQNAPLNTLNRDTIHLDDHRGYTDYPTLEQLTAKQQPHGVPT